MWLASEEVAEPEQRPDGLGVIWHCPIVGVPQLVWVHFHQSGFDVESHHRSIASPQTSLLGVVFQLVLFQKGKDSSQVLGVELPGLVE